MPDSPLPNSLPPLSIGASSRVRAKNTPAPGLTDAEAQVDMRRVRAYRLGRVRAGLRARDYAGCVLFDPINIRYAVGARNMVVWTMHNAARYCFIPTEGPIVLFDFHNCEHLSAGAPEQTKPKRSPHLL